jgi:hypothetical protein
MMTWINGYTTSGGTPVYVDFNSIPATYTHLQLRYSMRDTSAFTTRGVFLEINGNTQGNINSEHYMKGNGSTVTSSGSTSLGRMDWSEIPAASMAANTFGVGTIDFFDYANTNKKKTIKVIHGYDVNGSGEINFWSGLWASTAAISSIRIYSNQAFADGTRVDLYGITSSQVTGA